MIAIPAWAPRAPVTLMVQSSTIGPTGTPTKTLTPSTTIFSGHWQPVSQQDAIKAGRTGIKQVREMWTEDAEASAITNGSVLGLDGLNWAVVNIERWPGDPVTYLLLEAIQ